MKLTGFERAMQAGETGEPRRRAIEHQLKVGHVHIMADTGVLGEAGVRFLEEMADFPAAERRVMVPTVTDPRGAAARPLAQSPVRRR